MADVMALHGFTQRGAMWDEVAAQVGGDWDSPDLPGHGLEPPVPWEIAVEQLRSRFEESGAATLIGYSMGGRLALALALQRPVGLERLVLVSASPGLPDPGERERRVAEDEILADRIERLGLDLFLTEWLARPMFSGLGRRPSAWGSRDLRMRLTNEAGPIAATLRLLGQGRQPALGDEIGGLDVPLVTMAGALDDTYVGHARRMAGTAGEGRHVEVRGAGHAVVGEDPGAVARVLQEIAGSGTPPAR